RALSLCPVLLRAMRLYRRKTAGGLDPEELIGIIGSIYESALDLTQWQTAMERIAHAAGGHRALMFVPDMTSAGEFWAAHDIDPSMMSGYAEHYREKDLWTDRCARYLTVTGSTISGEMVMSDREYVRSE